MLALDNLARIEIAAENWEAASEIADRYREMAPLDANAYRLKSRLLMQMGEQKELEPYIVMAKCLDEEPVPDAEAWCGEAKTRYGAAADFSKAECPEEVRVHVDSSENDWVIGFYWAESKAVVYYDGEKKGEFEVTREETD
jgi:DNA-binding SARP family transcriptional activator